MQHKLLAALFGHDFHWFRKAIEIDESLWSQIINRYRFFQRLDVGELSRLKTLTTEFFEEKEFSGAGGLELTDEICLTVAAQGCLPILNLGLDYYKGWVGIIVYPGQFVVPRTVVDDAGVVHHYQDIVSGEAWDKGPLIISWQDAQHTGSGHNVILHEFAHKLDMANGEVEGMPPLSASQSRQHWQHVFHEAYSDFCRKLDAVERGHEHRLHFNPYGATSPAEFFAVMSEAFFEIPEVFYHHYPKLFKEFSLFYQQQPLKAEH